MIELIVVIEQFETFLSVKLFQESGHLVSATEDLIEFLIPESDDPVILDRASVIDLFDIGPHDGTKTHRTGLSGCIKNASFQVMSPEILPGFPDRLYLAVCCRIVVIGYSAMLTAVPLR